MKTKLKTFKNEKEVLARVEFLKVEAIEKLDFQTLANHYAHFRVLYEVTQSETDQQKVYQKKLNNLNKQNRVSHTETLTMLESVFAENIEILAFVPHAFNAGVRSYKNKVAKEKTEKAKIAADSLHNKPDGSRAKVKKMQDMWATGKFTNRDLCAEQECAALGMSFSTARKALRNTPKPT